MKINHVISTDGDWEALYIDGVLKEEGHSLDVWHVLNAIGLEFTQHTIDFDSLGYGTLPLLFKEL